MAKCLVFLSAIFISGCCATVDHRVGQPQEPQLLPVEQELWDAVPPHVQAIWKHNRLEWEDFYDDATGRIRLHDDKF